MGKRKKIIISSLCFLSAVSSILMTTIKSWYFPPIFWSIGFLSMITCGILAITVEKIDDYFLSVLSHNYRNVNRT